ncbi:MAG: thioredoxin-dependent thiol peroxidase [Flavobacteriaceae bacterium]|nr:thioredoxin-dependent thiol peroxidase [Flavobacteriaceae bacterium]
MYKINIGERIPDIESIDHMGVKHKFSDYIGKKLIFFFYPKANTPGCTVQACNLRDNYSKLKKMGYVLFGISADNVSNQKKFSDKYNFPFILIADSERKIIEAFGVWGLKKFMGKEYEGILRTTFIINEKGIVENIIAKVKTKDHFNQILEAS